MSQTTLRDDGSVEFKCCTPKKHRNQTSCWTMSASLDGVETLTLTYLANFKSGNDCSDPMPNAATNSCPNTLIFTRAR